MPGSIRRIGVLAGVVALATGLTGAARAAAPAGAVSGLTSGSWWQAQPDAGVLQPPPNVPANGLWVEADGNGPTAISAVRFTLQGATAPTLRLRVSQAQPASQVQIVACPTASPWKPATAGPWSARPTPDCSGLQAAGTLSPDGTIESIDLSGLPVGADGTVDVAIIPAMAAAKLPVAVPGPLPSPGPVFDATFLPVKTSDVDATATSPASTPDTASAPDTAPTPATVAAAPDAAGSTAPIATGAPLLAPLPSATVPAGPVAPDTAPAPQSLGIGPAPRPVASTQPIDRATQRWRWLLAMIVVDIAIFAQRRGWFDGGAGRRPPVTLYDADSGTTGPVVERTGRAPALR